jgi:hypothetical protein
MLVYSARLFGLLWAVALVFTGISPVSWSGSFENLWSSALLLAGGLTLIADSGNIWCLRIASFLCVVSWMIDLPVVPNHRWAHLCIALSVLIGGFRAKSFSEVYEAIRGTLRWLIVIVYLFAALAKMNLSYFDPLMSCSGVFGEQTVNLYGIEGHLPANLAQWISLWSLIMEILLPILLFWPYSRGFGVCLGVLFHLSLSLHYVKYFANFSTAMFVLLASWMTEEACKRVYDALRQRFSAINPVSLLGACGIVLASFLDVVGQVEYIIMRHIVYLLFALRFTYFTVIYRGVGKSVLRVGAPIGFVILLELLNGFSPYFGVKTRSALTMYSNLKIEPGYSNHFFMPPAFDPFGYFADAVDVISSEDPGLRRRIETESSRLPYVSFCAYLACQDDLCNRGNIGSNVTYRRGSDTLTATLGDPLPRDCPGWVARKLIFLGPIGPGSERGCNW